jgi:hypothetical protein
MASYLLVNKETKIAENVIEWDGDLSVWTPPEIDLTLLVSTTPSIDWVWNEENQEWQLGEETIGNGGIGDTWDGTNLIKPKPTTPPVVNIESSE